MAVIDDFGEDVEVEEHEEGAVAKWLNLGYHVASVAEILPRETGLRGRKGNENC